MSPAETPPPRSAMQAFRDGLVAAWTSVFVLVLLGNYVGIGALAYEFGFSLNWMLLSTVLVWAAPAQVILISTLNTATLIEVALAVTLSSVRFLPMVVVLLPILKTKERAGAGRLVLPMHLTAISVWVEGMRLLPERPAPERVGFYNGLGIGLISAACLASIVGYMLAARLPAALAAALLFLTPMALLMSVSRNSRTLIDKLAFSFGLVVGPVLAAHKVGLDLVWTGLIAGTAAYVIHRVREAAR